jgi:hypothetical protein
MKTNYKSVLSTFAIACAVGVPLSFTTAHELPVQAALTAPAGWELKYTNESFPGYKISNGTTTTTPLYTRTADSTYYNYTTTWDNGDSSIIPNGLSITMTFNRSNTTWYDASSGNYVPNDTKIGSASNYVGSAFNNRIQLTLNNQTNKNYVFWLDLSSSSTDYYFDLLYDNSNYYFYDTDVLFSKNTLKKIYLPSYTDLQLNSLAAGSVAMYLDAWYLDDLGVSDSYNNGYDDGVIDGYDDGYQDAYNDSAYPLIDAVETVFGIFANFVLMIMSLQIFDISLLNIGVILIAILGLVWVLKAIRG